MSMISANIMVLWVWDLQIELRKVYKELEDAPGKSKGVVKFSLCVCLSFCMCVSVCERKSMHTCFSEKRC